MKELKHKITCGSERRNLAGGTEDNVFPIAEDEREVEGGR